MTFARLSDAPDPDPADRRKKDEILGEAAISFWKYFRQFQRKKFAVSVVNGGPLALIKGTRHDSAGDDQAEAEAEGKKDEPEAEEGAEKDAGGVTEQEAKTGEAAVPVDAREADEGNNHLHDEKEQRSGLEEVPSATATATPSEEQQPSESECTSTKTFQQPRGWDANPLVVQDPFIVGTYRLLFSPPTDSKKGFKRGSWC